MPAFAVETPQTTYSSVVERGILGHASEYLPKGAGKLFIVTTDDVWRLHQQALDPQLTKQAYVVFFPGGEANKRLSSLEKLAEELMEGGADRTSLVVTFGGGIVTDVGGFLAAVFMRGIPVLQIPTTLLAQVDAAVGGKTGVNLATGKNLIGSFHQPLAVLIDPDVLKTLPDREYRAGLYEVIKCAIIRDPALFELLKEQPEKVLARDPVAVDTLVAAAVRIKAEVVSADEREGDLRRILNFGHTVGHAIEAETNYTRFLHGEAIGWGMLVAIRLAELGGKLSSQPADEMRRLITLYSSQLPSATGLGAHRLLNRLANDKKTLQGKIHFVLPVAIGKVAIFNGIEAELIERSISETLCLK
ncbi:MAG TPA: 3-dehydroquinate synthase [Bryobacteraceae bacterium]|jgi:3-dehydroquinate synthase|nr:3-dehydroquinate synthase [Bryobacteraceae bacterium]